MQINTPIGYQNNGKRQLKTIDPVKGPLIKLAFELYASGQYSFDSLRQELATRGLTQPSGNPLSRGCLEKFFGNPFYTGIICIRKTGDIFAGGHEPLVTAATFERVKEVRAGKSGKKLTRHNHLYRRLFRCGTCSKAMIPERQKQRFVYYRCQNRSCAQNCVREERLDAALANLLAETTIPDSAVCEIERRVARWSRAASASREAATLSMKRSHVEERLVRLEDAVIDGLLDAERYASRKQALLLERKALEDAEHKRLKFHQSPAVIRAFLERLKNLAEHYAFANADEKRAMVEIVSSNRIVSAKNVSVEPSNWLHDTRSALRVFSCAPPRTTSRTSLMQLEHGNQADCDEQASEIATPAPTSDNRSRHVATLPDHVETEQIEALITVATAPEAERLFARFMSGYDKAAGFRRSKGANHHQS